MNIFDHLVPDNAILGIGPLITDDYSRKDAHRYYFQLHLCTYSIVIYSDYFYTPHNDYKEQWVNDYKATRQKVAVLVGVEEGGDA